MRFQEIQKMAKEMGINTYRMKKADIIQGIQRKESNIDCYGTSRVDYCEEARCLWRSDCLSSNSNGNGR
ncbi:MAG: Rho termination factor N-terminal domain-containing protein [Deltaproteobacteria bacterium]|nr:Rho termination factor N-terminal domain-containing protein [Deltaproteobacteria bacterium]